VLVKKPTYLLRLAIVGLALVIVAACQSTLSASRWVHNDDIVQVLGNRWRVHEVLVQQRPLSFTSLTPVYVSFSETHIGVVPTNCNGMYAALLPNGVRRYRWGESVSTAIGCPQNELDEVSALMTAFVSTTSYALQQNQLILRGADVQIILVVDNTPPTPTPLPPTPISYPAPT
jgi:heat shock protein HslJ